MKAIRTGGPNGPALARKGFTLLELIVVITIIGILGTLVVVKVGGFTGTAKVTKIKNDMQAIFRAAEIYKVTTGGFPQSIDELKNPPQNAATGSQSTDPLLDQNVKDPWNNDYLYEIDSTGKPVVRCYGKDGAQGGEGDDKDYSYPETEGA